MECSAAIKQQVLATFNDFQIYPDSINCAEGCTVFIARDYGEKLLVVVADEDESAFDAFVGPEIFHSSGKRVKAVSLHPVNAALIRRMFPFTAPVPFGKQGMSIGLGDRLGLASPGHLRLVKGTNVRPVLAQQSIRELTLTNRTYQDVLDAATWAVLQEGYRDGFSADGDHLKTPNEVKMALDLGFTMITLDASEQIDNEVMHKRADQIQQLYSQLPEEYRAEMEEAYLGKTLVVEGAKITFDGETLQQLVLIYGRALAFMGYIYHSLIESAGRSVDFEVSIDETTTPTTPAAHYFVAAELTKMGVDFTSLAPRFCGEFQKGIDYIGDLAQFEEEFRIHARIADHFGYRLSIHSGSDKFSVFPIIGQYTNGRVHVKTAGTNWLEALRVIAAKKPAFFREIYAFALIAFDEAKKYYHVTANIAKAPAVQALADADLPSVLEQNDARQILHITYGLILTAATSEGAFRFRDELYATLDENEDAYYQALEHHIGRHLAGLMKNS